MKDLPLESGLTKPMKLSDDLADIVGKKEASRAECVKELWAYVKKNDLQDPKNKQFFKPDKKLAKVFGTDRIRGFGMVKFLKTHLSEKWPPGIFNIWWNLLNKSGVKGRPEKKQTFGHLCQQNYSVAFQWDQVPYLLFEINTNF